MQPQVIWCDGVLREGRARNYGVHIELGFIYTFISAEQKVKSVLVAFIYFIFIYLPSANLLYLR